MGNNSGFKVNEPALGQWVCVLRKGMQNRKDILKDAVLSEATKKSSFYSGQCRVPLALPLPAVLKSFELTPGATSLAVANAAGNVCPAASQSSSKKPESLKKSVVKTLCFSSSYVLWNVCFESRRERNPRAVVLARILLRIMTLQVHSFPSGPRLWRVAPKFVRPLVSQMIV